MSISRSRARAHTHTHTHTHTREHFCLKIIWEFSNWTKIDLKVYFELDEGIGRLDHWDFLEFSGNFLEDYKRSTSLVILSFRLQMKGQLNNKTLYTRVKNMKSVQQPIMVIISWPISTGDHCPLSAMYYHKWQTWSQKLNFARFRFRLNY